MNYDDLEIDDLIKDLQRDYLSDQESDSVAESLESILGEYSTAVENTPVAPIAEAPDETTVQAHAEEAPAAEQPEAPAEDDFFAQFADALGMEIGQSPEPEAVAAEPEAAPVEVEPITEDDSEPAPEQLPISFEEEAPAVEEPAEDALPDSADDFLPESEDEDEEKKPILDSLKAFLPKKKQKAKKKAKAKAKADAEAEPEDDEEDSYPAYVTVLHDVVYMMAAIMLIFVFVVRLVGVKGSSMVPTYSNGDRVMLLSNFISDNYQQGDVIVLIAPDYDESTPLIKRVIATEGQTVNINFASGKVYVDNELLEEDYINDITTYNPGGMTYPVEVPEGCVFVMGDNRNHSTDSRNAKVGFVNKDEVLGKVLFRLFHSKASSGTENE